MITLLPAVIVPFQVDRVSQTLAGKTPIRKSVVYQDMIYHAGGGTACSG
ncbi:hypothetical protein [Nonomuraea sp. bgisy101]